MDKNITISNRAKRNRKAVLKAVSYYLMFMAGFLFCGIIRDLEEGKKDWVFLWALLFVFYLFLAIGIIIWGEAKENR